MSEAKTAFVNEVKYLIKNKNDIIENSLMRGNQWNNDIVILIGLCIKKYNLKHFVNIGSHIGTVALPISKYIRKVTAIEAFPPTYDHFLENIKLNKFKNINSFNLALGDREDKVYFLDSDHDRIKNNSGGMHVITQSDIDENRLSSEIHNKKFNNEMKRLDDLNISNFDILLADVEGKEYELLKGAVNKINKYKPIIIIEIWNNKKRKLEKMLTSKEEIINYIINLGYKLINQIGDNYIFLPINKK